MTQENANCQKILFKKNKTKITQRRRKMNQEMNEQISRKSRRSVSETKFYERSEDITESSPRATSGT